jgi:ATP synthase protein I
MLLTGCMACVCVQEVAASYLLGALGGITYLRLLHRSVDSVGDSSLGAAASAAMGQPRLLIPAILVAVYNRCVLPLGAL